MRAAQFRACIVALVTMSFGLGAAQVDRGNGSISMAKAADGDPPADRSPVMRPARDPKIAVQEEYDLARRRGTPAALELFIQRHGDDPLAETARRELQRLRGRVR